MINKEIKFTSINNKMIDAMVYEPEVWNGKYIIYSNGFTISYRVPNKSRLSWIEQFTKLGYKFITYDYIGYGESDGEFTDSVVTDHINDLMSVINQLDNEEVLEFILMGISLGGLVTKETFESMDNDKFKKCILLCPAINLNRIFKEDNRDKIVSPLFSWDDTEYINRMKNDLTKYAESNNRNKGNGNYLIVHGIIDELIPVEHSKEYTEKFDNVTLATIENGPHNLWSVRKASNDEGSLSIEGEALRNAIKFISD